MNHDPKRFLKVEVMSKTPFKNENHKIPTPLKKLPKWPRNNSSLVHNLLIVQ